MESFSDDEDQSPVLSELELDELIETRFVEGSEESEDVNEEKIETVRAVGSPMALSPMENQEILLEDIYSQKIDNAVKLLIRIQNSTEQKLRNVREWNLFEISKKKKNTSRVSELALIDYLISNFDRRPSLLHLFCRRLIESDIQEMIRKAIFDGEAPRNYRSIFRMTIKTDMPLKQLIGQLEIIWKSSNAIELRNPSVTANQKNLDGTMRKYRTLEVLKFSEMEQKITLAHIQPMSACAHFTFTFVGRPFVTVNVDYHNELDENGRRQKTVVLEQTVTPNCLPTRRVTFGTPLVEKVHEFELDEMAPFHPLRFKIFDLIQYLECVGPIANMR